MSEIITNDRGGKQSKIKGKMTEVPPLALIEVSRVMGLGSENYPREKGGTPNWHNIDCISNLDHAMEHAANYLVERNKPDRDKDSMREELSHFAARAMMTIEQFIREEFDGKNKREIKCIACRRDGDCHMQDAITEPAFNCFGYKEG